MDVDYDLIAQEAKKELQNWLKREYIEGYEWEYLIGEGFPFNPPNSEPINNNLTNFDCFTRFRGGNGMTNFRAMTTGVKISELDASPLIALLKGRNPKGLRQEELQERAWQYIMEAATGVWGG